jgi:hypothetical protein
MTKNASSRSKQTARGKLAEAGLQPLAIDVAQASAMCGMSAAQFQKEVAAANFPPPIGGLLSKRKLWSVAALERAVNGKIDTQQSRAAFDRDDLLMREIKSRAARTS